MFSVTAKIFIFLFKVIATMIYLKKIKC